MLELLSLALLSVFKIITELSFLTCLFLNLGSFKMCRLPKFPSVLSLRNEKVEKYWFI